MRARGFLKIPIPDPKRGSGPGSVLHHLHWPHTFPVSQVVASPPCPTCGQCWPKPPYSTGTWSSVEAGAGQGWGSGMQDLTAVSQHLQLQHRVLFLPQGIIQSVLNFPPRYFCSGSSQSSPVISAHPSSVFLQNHYLLNFTLLFGQSLSEPWLRTELLRARSP